MLLIDYVLCLVKIRVRTRGVISMDLQDDQFMLWIISWPIGTTVWEMTGPDLWVPIIFFFSAAWAEKLRETTMNAGAGKIKGGCY
jgi:hypothetical protein